MNDDYENNINNDESEGRERKFRLRYRGLVEEFIDVYENE